MKKSTILLVLLMTNWGYAMERVQENEINALPLSPEEIMPEHRVLLFAEMQACTEQERDKLERLVTSFKDLTRCVQKARDKVTE